MTNEDCSFGGWRACDVCGEAIAAIDDAVLVLREQLFAERRTTLEADGRPPGPVAWDWGHRDCFTPLGLRYVIDGPRLDSLPQMMARTLQLLDEEWFRETAWEDAVRRFYRIPFE